MAKITISRTLSALTDSVTAVQGNSSTPWLTSSPLVPVNYDAMALGYDTSGNITSVAYSLGGTVLATLTLTYTNGNLTAVART